MLCLRCVRGLTVLSKPSTLWQGVDSSLLRQTSNRTFTSLRGPYRPTLFPSSFTPTTTFSANTPAVGAAGQPLDLLSKISTHPALGSIQVRCGPRDTFDPSHFVRKRRHGFLSRIRTRKGRALLKRRRAKNRSTMSH